MKKLLCIAIFATVLPVTGFGFQFVCPLPANVQTTFAAPCNPAAPNNSYDWSYTDSTSGYQLQFGCAGKPIRFNSADLMWSYDLNAPVIGCSYIATIGSPSTKGAPEMLTTTAIPTNCHFTNGAGYAPSTSNSPWAGCYKNDPQQCAIECS